MAKKAAKAEKPVEDVKVDETAFDADFDVLLTGVEDGTLEVPATEDEGDLKAAKAEKKAVADPPPEKKEEEEEEKEETIEEKVAAKEKEEEGEEENVEIDHEARAAVLEGIIEDMASGDAPAPAAAKEKPAEPAEKVAPVQEFVQQPVVDTPVEFYTVGEADEYDTGTQEEHVADVKQKNEVANTILAKAQERTIVKLVPILAQLIPEYVEMKIETEIFYAKNPELKRIKAYTGKVLNEVRRENPKMALSKQLDKTKEEVYTRLKLPGKQAAKNGAPKARNPKFAGPGSNARPIKGHDENKNQNEFDDMLEVVA